VFDPYHDTESNIPSFLHRLVDLHAPPLRSVRHPVDWCHAQLEGFDLLLQPAPAATRPCLQHYFDAHRRHSESTSVLALIACVASSDWFRLTRYFRDHLVVRYSSDGTKLVYPVLVALSPRLHLLAITTLLGGRRSKQGSYAYLLPLLPAFKCSSTHPHLTTCCCGVELLTPLAPFLHLYRCLHLASLIVLRGGQVRADMSHDWMHRGLPRQVFHGGSREEAFDDGRLQRYHAPQERRLLSNLVRCVPSTWLAGCIASSWEASLPTRSKRKLWSWSTLDSSPGSTRAAQRPRSTMSPRLWARIYNFQEAMGVPIVPSVWGPSAHSPLAAGWDMAHRASKVKVTEVKVQPLSSGSSAFNQLYAAVGLSNPFTRPERGLRTGLGNSKLGLSHVLGEEKVATARLPMSAVLACQNHCLERAHESKKVEGKPCMHTGCTRLSTWWFAPWLSFDPASFRSVLYTACGCTTSRTWRCAHFNFCGGILASPSASRLSLARGRRTIGAMTKVSRRGQQFDADGRGSDVVIIVARPKNGLIPGRVLGAILLLRGVPVGATAWPEHISRSDPFLRTVLSPKDSAHSSRRLKYERRA
jgi:hypothetical protein